jgi:hypothetical protein
MEKLVGIVCCHVDDLLIAGNDSFYRNVVEKLFKLFLFSKVEQKKFKYLGCEIEKQNNGDIILNQNEYVKKIEEVEFPSRRNSCKVNETERKIFAVLLEKCYNITHDEARCSVRNKQVICQYYECNGKRTQRF